MIASAISVFVAMPSRRSTGYLITCLQFASDVLNSVRRRRSQAITFGLTADMDLSRQRVNGPVIPPRAHVVTSGCFETASALFDGEENSTQISVFVIHI